MSLVGDAHCCKAAEVLHTTSIRIKNHFLVTQSRRKEISDPPSGYVFNQITVASEMLLSECLQTCAGVAFLSIIIYPIQVQTAHGCCSTSTVTEFIQ